MSSSTPPAQAPSPQTVTLLTSQYHTYRHTLNLDTQGHFFSPTCLQICRPMPTYSATTRAQIVQYQKDAAWASDLKAQENPKHVDANVRGVYTIRRLSSTEARDFSTQEITSQVGLSPDELGARADEQGWVGMRVDLWDEGAPLEGSMMVKVQYWWRWEDVALDEELEGDKEGKGWRQCLHDIMYIGQKDGSEREEGLEVRDLPETMG
jgi:hypothetical protein